MPKIGERKEGLAELEKAIPAKRSDHENSGREVKELKAKESVSMKRLAELRGRAPLVGDEDERAGEDKDFA